MGSSGFGFNRLELGAQELGQIIILVGIRMMLVIVVTVIVIVITCIAFIVVFVLLFFTSSSGKINSLGLVM